MESIINNINSDLLKGNVELPNGIIIPTKDYITFSVIPFLPNSDNIKLNNGETISVTDFIEKYVLTECIKHYNGDFKKYLEEVTNNTLENIVESIETLEFINENTVDGMSKETKLEIEKELSSVEYSNSDKPNIVAEKTGEVSILKKNDKGNLSFESKYLHTLKKSDNFELILEMQSLQFSLALFDIVLFSNKNKDVRKVEAENNKVISDFESVKDKIKNDKDLEYVKDYLNFIATIGTVGKFYSKPLLEKIEPKKETKHEYIPPTINKPVIENINISSSKKVEDLLIEIEKQDKLWDVLKDNVRYTTFDNEEKNKMVEKYNSIKEKINEYKKENILDGNIAENLLEQIEEKIDSLTDTQDFTGYGY